MSWFGDWFGDDSYLGRLGNWAVDDPATTLSTTPTTAIPNPGTKLGGDLLKPSDDKKTETASWTSDLFRVGLPAAVDLGSMLWADKRNQANIEEDRLREAQELALKAKYGLLGNQGGGGSRTANLINAYGQAANINQASANAKGQALANLIAASTRPLLR